VTTINDVLNALAKGVDLLETDHEIIQSFEWVTDDETPLPVDPADYAQLKAAVAWVANERLRYTRAVSDREFERWVDRLDETYDPFEDDDTIEGFERYDASALIAFRDACQRRMTAMERADHDRLNAWNAGVSIRG
jgi:hypothetical protein